MNRVTAMFWWIPLVPHSLLLLITFVVDGDTKPSAAAVTNTLDELEEKGKEEEPQSTETMEGEQEEEVTKEEDKCKEGEEGKEGGEELKEEPSTPTEEVVDNVSSCKDGEEGSLPAVPVETDTKDESQSPPQESKIDDCDSV